MKSGIPLEVKSWCKDNNYTLLSAQVLQGRFTSTLFQLTVQTALKKPFNLICKQTSKHNIEVKLYSQLLAHKPSLAPSCLAAIPASDASGGTILILQDAGIPLKRKLHQSPAAAATQLLASAAQKLADMHARLEHSVETQRDSGALLPSLETAALPWRQNTVEELTWLYSLRSQDAMVNDDILEDTNHLLLISKKWLHLAPEFYSCTSERVTITHGDPHLDNWLINGNELRLIDWEYAGVAVPQRDLAVLLQDVLEPNQQRTVYNTYTESLAKHQWEVSSKQFHRDFQIHFLDNSLMMLGWDISSYRMGMLDKQTFKDIFTAKAKWIENSVKLLL